jgi:hypothetical protein
MMNTIHIKKSPSAKSKIEDGTLTESELFRSTRMHVADVQQAMNTIADMIKEAAKKHDHTKFDNMKQFYDSLMGKEENSDGFAQHAAKERHHLEVNVPTDVNIVDVVEYICDIVMAGMARSGEVYDSTLQDKVLGKALKNTVKMLIDNTRVADK